VVRLLRRRREYLGAAIPILVTLAVEGHGAALILLGYVLIYQLLENSWLSPKLSARTMSLSGGLAFASALAGGSLAGPVGAFLVLPTAALIFSFIPKSRPDLRGGLLGWGKGQESRASAEE